MTLLVLGMLALVGLLVLALVASTLGIVWFVVSLPFRLIGFLVRLPFILFGLAVAAIVITLLVVVPLAFLLAPALIVCALAYGVWRLATRSHKAAAV